MAVMWDALVSWQIDDGDVDPRGVVEVPNSRSNSCRSCWIPIAAPSGGRRRRWMILPLETSRWPAAVFSSTRVDDPAGHGGMPIAALSG
nr:unnamed protein product [Digitaria exilis]